MASLKDGKYVDDQPAVEPTRAQYLNHEVSFEEYYRAIARDAGIAFTADDKMVKRAQRSTDEHFNDIPLNAWDSLAEYARGALARALKLHGDSFSLAGGVCVMKQAVRDAISPRND